MLVRVARAMCFLLLRPPMQQKVLSGQAFIAIARDARTELAPLVVFQSIVALRSKPSERYGLFVRALDAEGTILSLTRLLPGTERVGMEEFGSLVLRYAIDRHACGGIGFRHRNDFSSSSQQATLPDPDVVP
jgi:EAL domain-containing protein (putative c-di-GMP-specific phosphodiesterase class I)